MKKQIHLRFDQELYDEIKKLVSKLGITTQECFEIAIKELLYQSSHEKPDKSHYSFVELFAGIGGMRIALERCAGICVFASEDDRFSQKTYFTNFGMQPSRALSEMSIDSIPPHDILSARLLLENLKDGLNTPVYQMLFRIIRDRRPKAVIFESPRNILAYKNGAVLEEILNSLQNLDYVCFYTLLKAESYVAQEDERFVLVAFDGQRYKSSLHFDLKPQKTQNRPKLRDILLDEVEDKYTLSDRLWNYRQETNASAIEDLAKIDCVSRALRSRYYKDGFEILIGQEGKNPRKLTPRECARLQGFPDSFKIPVSDTQAYKQFGSSVIVPMMQDVAAQVCHKLDNLEEELNKIYEIEYII